MRNFRFLYAREEKSSVQPADKKESATSASCDDRSPHCKPDLLLFQLLISELPWTRRGRARARDEGVSDVNFVLILPSTRYKLPAGFVFIVIICA